MSSSAWQSLRGMHDALPERCTRLQVLEQQLQAVALQHNFQEIRTPLLEATALFARGVGEDSDIVSKEMYQFVDKGGDSVCLRPENTASVVRAALQHNLLRSGVNKLWYLGPMFRYERPQKGRYRQLHQFGCEIIGDDSVSSEAELLALSALLFERLGIAGLQLEVNHLGSARSRGRYRAALRDYLQQHQDQLDPDSQRRLHTNPLRILDSKNAQTQALLKHAPQLEQYLEDSERQRFAELLKLLAALQLPVRHNQLLVRGLDYYTGVVFEWTSSELGAQATVCAGGRYDELVAEFGGPPTPALGFALGIERLELLAQLAVDNSPDVYVISLQGAEQSLRLLHTMRRRAPWLRLHYSATSSKFVKQLQKADKSGAPLALILNAEGDSISLKQLRAGGTQRDFSPDQLDSLLSTIEHERTIRS